MADAQESKVAGIGKRRAVLLAGLVIAAVGGGIHLASAPDKEPPPKEYIDNDVVEVAPLVPASRMSGASWRSAEQVREDRAAEEQAAVGESVFDNVEWAEDDETRAYDKSVEDTVKDIDGLGVYVAPAEGAKKPGGAKQPGKAAPK